MRAVRISEFGGPEVLNLVEIERPTPAPDEILVRVYATSVNPADYVIRQGGNDFLKPYLKLPMGLGLDVSGVVEEVGRDVTKFEAGDEVYGVPNFLGGSYTEYLAAKANQFALKPKSITFNEAGAVPSCALVAWSGIIESGNVQQGQRVLIHGAAGGVGSLALQFAKSRGAYVIGTASANNHAFLKQLGADEVIDYRNKWGDAFLNNIDLVFNASPVRDESARKKSVEALKDGGIFVCTQLDYPFSPDVLRALERKNAKGTFVGGSGREDCLNATARLIDEGKIRVIVSRVYSLEEVAEAHRESETKHVRGKIVLEIRKEN